MLRTSIRIYVIKNISTQISGSYSVSVPNGGQTTNIPLPGGGSITSTSVSSINFPNSPSILSNNFNYSAVTQATGGSLAEFQTNYALGLDVAFQMDFANNIEIDHSYKNLTKTCKITLPRNMDKQIKNLYLLLTEGTLTTLNNTTIKSVPLFGRGDRILIQLGYNNEFTEVFRGYITKVSLTTPIQLECEDSMFLLKNMQFNISPTDKNNNRTNLLKKGKITLQDLVTCMLSNTYNNLLQPGQNVFTFPSEVYSNAFEQDFGINRTDGMIPVYFDEGINSEPFRFNTHTVLSIAETFQELKKNFPFLIFYFDDFYNFRIGLQFTNDSTTFVSDNAINFYFDSENGNIIDEKSMKYQRANETNVQIIMVSKPTNKKNKTLTASSDPNNHKLGYFGSPGGNIIHVNAPNDLTQSQLNLNAQSLYNSQIYDGWTKDSSFTTFGLPVVHIGNKLNLTSFEYPEKNGIFMVTGVKHIMGMNGYRQVINIGAKISS